MSALHHLSHISNLSDSNRSEEGLQDNKSTTAASQPSKSSNADWSTTHQQHNPSITTSNSLLFKNFMEYLVHIHDHEIPLMECQSQQLVQLIKQRDRDTEEHPYPFDVEEEKILSEEVKVTDIGQDHFVLF